MALEEIIIYTLTIVISAIILITIVCSIISKIKTREKQEEVIPDWFDNKERQLVNLQNVFYSGIDKNQLALPFETNTREEIIENKNWRSNHSPVQKRYTIVNQPYSFDVKKVSNFY